jgi:hypothetical protein
VDPRGLEQLIGRAPTRQRLPAHHGEAYEGCAANGQQGVGDERGRASWTPNLFG